MPIARFQLPDGRIARFEVPEGTTPEQAQALIEAQLDEVPPTPTQKQPTIGGQTKEFFKGLIPGGIGLVEQAGIGISALLPEEQERATQQYIKEVAATAKAPFAAAPGYEDTIPRKFGEAAGSIIPFLATGPFGVAGRLAGYGLGIGAGAGTQVEKSAAEGATAEQQTTATALGSVVGASEMFAPTRILRRIGEPIAAGAAAFVKRALMAGGEEAAQEAASQAAQNIITKGIYKPEQEIIEQVGESAAYGGAVGALAQGLLDLALGRRVTGTSAQQAQQPEAAPEAAAIPEPTLREDQAPETAAGTPEAQILKEAIAPKKQAAMDKQLAKEQQEYLKKYQTLAAQREADQAEKERIAAMSPEEFAAEQMQGVGKQPKVKPVDQEELAALGYQTQPSFVSGEVDNFTAQQLALVKDRELAPDDNTYADYLMVNPALARQIALSEQPIPGLPAKLNYKVKRNILDTLKLQDQAAAKAAADAQAARQERGARLLAPSGAQANQELLGAARETPAAQAQAWERGERERIEAQERAEKARIAKLTPEEYKAELSQVKQKELPEGEEPALMDENDPLLKQLVEALPRDNGRVLPGQVYEGLGGGRTARKDLQAQLAVARITGNRAEMSRIKDQIDAGKERQEVGGFGKTTEAAKELGGNVTPESRANEVKADQYADQQRSTLLGLVKLLNTRNPLTPGQVRRGATLSLPGVFEKRISDNKEAFVTAHANEIEARRAAFGLPPMADWERAEARARALEALNELSDRWSTFGAPVQAVGVLQQQVREATHQNLLNAAKRFNLEAGKETQEKLATFAKQPQKYTNYKGEEIEVPRETGPRIGAPDELTLKGTPRIPEDDRAAASKFITAVLSQVERRTRATPTVETKPAAKVGSMEDIAKLFEESKEGARSAKIDAATVAFLTRLQDNLETSTDPEFASLAREQAQRVMEGNLPDPMAVRDLDEMMKGREVSGRSAAKPLSAEETAAVARGEKKYEAQPQKELFPEASVQTVRATPANFQRLLASKDIQGLRDAIAKQKADNLAALQSVGKEIPNLKNKLTKAEQNYKAKLAKAQKTTPKAKTIVRDMDEDLTAANEALTAISQKYRFVSSQLTEIEDMRNALLAAGESGTIDARFSLEANALMQQEKALRKQQDVLIKQLSQAHELVGAIEAFQEIEKKRVAPILKENEKANADLAKAQEDLTKAKQERLGETRIEKLRADAERQKQQRAEEEKISEGERPTDLETYRQSLQRGREGLDLPGLRVEKDTTGMKSEINEIRSEMGSLNELIADENTTPEKRAVYETQLEDAEERLASVYERAPRVTTELQSRDEERAMREYDDAQAAAYDEAKAKRAKRAGEKTERLVPTRGTALLKSVTGSAISQPRKPNKTVEVGEEVTDKLVEAKTKLAEIQRRIAYLKDNNKHKVAGRLTDAFKDLQGKEQLQKQKLTNIQKRQSKIVAVEKQATSGYTREKQKEALNQSKAAEKESERFARGVEVESPNLTDTQIAAIEENDITAAYADIANDKSASKVNRVVAQRLATLLDDTDIAIKDKLTDKDGKEVLGMATSKVIGLNRNGGLSQEVFLHEGIHAATERVIQLPESRLSRTQLIAKRELMALHNAIKNDPRITSVSAKGSLSEFVAEVMSNRNLQEQLREKKWKLSDAWQGFKSIILRMLGIEHPETMLGAAIQSVDALMVPSSTEFGVEERPVSRRLSQKDIAALHTGSNSMKQFADQFGQDIKQKDRTPEDVERIAKDYLKDMERSPDKYIAAPTEDSLDYKAQTKMSDGKFFDVNNPLHYVEADVNTFAALKALEDKKLRVREAEEIRKRREDDLKSLIKLMRTNNSYTLAENALVAKAAAKYAVLSDKTGQLKLAEIADNNRHNVAVVSLDAADAVIRELRTGKNLKQAFLDGMQMSADRAAKENERKDGWQKFDQGKYDQQTRQEIREGTFARPVGSTEPRTRLLRLTHIQEKIIDNENSRRKVAGEPLLEKQGDIDPTIDFLDSYYKKLEAAPNKNEDLAIKLSKGCAGTPWCTAGEGTARSYLEKGDFYVYYKQGVPEVAVRMTGADYIAEVRGNSPNQALNLEQQKIAEEFLKKQNFTNGVGYLNEFATKEKLIKVAKGEAEITPADLAHTERIINQDGTVSKYKFEKLLEFENVDGHYRIRPDAPPKVMDFFANKYRTAAEKAFEDGYLYYSSLYVGSGDKEFKIEFASKTKTFLPSEIKAIYQLGVGSSTKEILFPSLRFVKSLGIHSGSLNLPQAENIDRVTVYSNKKKASTITLPSNAYVGEVQGSSAEEAFITIKGPKHIGRIVFYNSLGGLNISLPDTLYVKGDLNFGSARGVVNYKVKDKLVELAEQAGLKDARLDFNELSDGEPPQNNDTDALMAFGEAVIDTFNRAAKRTLGTDVFDRVTDDNELQVTAELRNPFAYVAEFQDNYNTYLEKKAGRDLNGLEQSNALKDMVSVYKSAFTFRADERLVVPEVGADMPKRIADTPPIEEMVERTAERPVYARAQAVGYENELSVASQVIAKPKTIGQQINANLGLSFRTQFLDRLAPLHKVAKDMLEPLKGMQMMHYLLASDQRMSYVQQAVGNGVPQRVAYKRPDGRTEYIVESVSGANLSNVVRTLAKAPDMNGEAANQLFTLYLLGKRADRVGYDKLNFSVDANSIKQAVRNIESNDKLRDVFEEARTEYNKYNKDLMNFLKDTGVLPPSVADELAATNDYIPYYREQNGNAELVIGKEGVYRIGNLTDQPQLRELIGGEDKILDFATSSIQNTSMIMDVGLRNLASKNAMFELVGLELAQFLGKDTASPDIVRFKDKGEEKFVRVATDAVGIPADLLVKGMEGIPVNTSALVRAMGFASGVVRKGVMLSPLYPVRQILRDSVAAPLLAGADFAGPLGALRALGSSATKKKLETRGITGGQVYTGTNQDLARILKDLMGGRMGLSQFVAKAEAISMEADAATRRAQYDSYIRQGLSQMEATVMALESMNFNKRGLSPSMHIAASMIPFFNSQVQGLDVLWRAASGQLPMSKRLDIQGKLLRRGSLLMATAVAYALMMQDDEAYKNARPDEKYGNFFIRIPGLDEPIKFPVPFEVGYIFKGIPEAMVNIMANKNGDEEAWKAFKTVAIQTIPGGSSMLVPALVKPLFENATNYSFFGQRELETKREQQLLPQQRFRDNTSEVAKEVGALVGYSPIKIDNLIRGYTGTMGLAAAQAVSFAMPENLGPQEATKRLSDTPVIGSMFQPNDAGGIINATYDRMEHIMEVKRTYDDMIKKGEMSEAKVFLQENVNEIASASIAGNTKTQLFKITQAMNAVKASSMTPDEKRATLDRLQRLRIKIADTMRGVLDKTAPQ
jgi:hypothetical protein